MLITKFNKLIRNKFVWGVFAILVSLSMIGFFAPRPGGDEEQRPNRIGQLFGEDVTREELMQARIFVQSFQPTRGGEEIRQQIEEEAWARIAMLRFARNQLGLSVANAELVQTIQNDPSFQQNGVFNRQQYQQLVRRQIGVPVPVFEAFIREEILISKIRNLVLDASLWIPASSLDDNAGRFTDTYSIAYVKADPEVEEVNVTAEDAQSLYTEDPERFRVPEQRSVVYATIPYTNYLAPEAVTTRQIEIRYESDPERFAVTNAETDIVSTQPLLEVEEDIRKELAQQEARAAAIEQAMLLVDEGTLVQEQGDTQPDIRALAADMNLSVSTSRLFQITGPAPDGVSAEGNFIQSAFQLATNTTSSPFSFSIPGTNAVYVQQLHQVVPAHIPPYESIAEKVLVEAKRIAQEEARMAAIERIHGTFEDQATDADSFYAAATNANLAVTEIKPFSLYEVDPMDIPLFQEIVPELLPLQAHELSPPIETEEGTVIAFLLDRTPAPPEERESIKPELNRMMLDALDQVHFVTWQEALLETARKTPTEP